MKHTSVNFIYQKIKDFLNSKGLPSQSEAALGEGPGVRVFRGLMLFAFLCFTTAQAQIAFDTVYTAPAADIFFEDMDCVGKTCYVAGRGTNFAPFVVKTTDGGDTWQVVTNNLTGASSALACVDENKCATTTSDGSSISGWYTTNGGQTWQNSTGFVNAYEYMYHVNGDTIIGTEAGQNMYISYNAGQTWQFLFTTSSGTWSKVQIVNSDFWIGFTGPTPTKKFIKSSNKGQTWEVLNANLDIGTVFCFTDTLHCFARVINRGLCESTDYGLTWNAVNYVGRDTTNTQQTNLSGIVVYDSTHALAVNYDFQLSKRDTLGWKGMSYSSIPNTAIVQNDRLEYMTKDSIMARINNKIYRSKDGSTNLDITSNIYQSTTSFYPNPAINHLIISNELAFSGFKGEIYDLLGNKVVSFQSNNKSLDLNISDLKSGLYLIKLNINNYCITSKILKL